MNVKKSKSYGMKIYGVIELNTSTGERGQLHDNNLGGLKRIEQRVYCKGVPDLRK